MTDASTATLFPSLTHPADGETPADAGFDPVRLKRLDDYMTGLVHEGRVAGANILLARHGRVVLLNAYGKASLARGTAMATDAIFRIYSMTKPVVGVAMMMLFEQGCWQLDDPVTKFIPEFGTLKVMTGVAPDGAMTVDDVRQPMTMRQLMSHTAGFGYGILEAHPVDRAFRAAQVLQSEGLQQMIDRTAGIPLMFQPGTGWSYSTAVDIQGYVVEKLSGMTLGQFLETRIFAPLKMVDTGFSVPPDQAHRLVDAYAADGTGRLQEATALFGMPINDFTRPPAMESGGGGLVSTVGDFARFCQMLLDKGVLDGVRILSPAAVELMATDVVPQSVLDHPDPAQLVKFSSTIGFGLGLMVEHEPRRNGSLVGRGTLSWGGAGGTWFWVDPDNDVIFVGMTQRMVDPISSEFRIKARTFTYQALTAPQI